LPNLDLYLDYDVILDRRRQRVRVGDKPSVSMNPDDFVVWCKGNGVTLRLLCPKMYEPEFRDDVARIAFEQKWMSRPIRLTERHPETGMTSPSAGPAVSQFEIFEGD